MKEQNVKVSILVPFYKVENDIGRCEEALFTQFIRSLNMLL